MLDESIQELWTSSRERIQTAKTPEELETARVDALGRKGLLNQLSKEMSKLPPEEKARIGKLLNGAKQELEAAYEARKQQFAGEVLQTRLEGEWLDLTLPAPGPRRGNLHPMTR